MKATKAIRTEYGILNGRDCIYLDEYSFDEKEKSLVLEGEINGNLAGEQKPGKWIAYKLSFSDVKTLRKTGLDLWEATTDYKTESSFDECFELTDADGHRNLIVQTYDDVIELTCKSYLLTFGEERT